MARFKQSVVIKRPVERVFAFVSGFENDTPCSGVAQARRTSADPLGVATTFQLRQRFLGRRLDVVLAVVRYEPNRVITVKTTSSRFLSMTGTRLLEPAGDATRLTLWAPGTPVAVEAIGATPGGGRWWAPRCGLSLGG